MTTNKEWWDNFIADDEWWDQFRETKIIKDDYWNDKETIIELQEIVMPEKMPKESKPFNVYKEHRPISQKERLKDEYADKCTKEYIRYINRNHKDQSYNTYDRITYKMFDRSCVDWSSGSVKRVRTYEDTKNLSLYTRFPSDGDDSDIPYWERAPVFFRIIIQTGEPIWYRPYSDRVDSERVDLPRRYLALKI